MKFTFSFTMSVATDGDMPAQPMSADGFQYPDIATNISEASRELIEFPARNGQDGYGPSGTTRVSFPLAPGQNYWDPINSHIMFDVLQTGGTNTKLGFIGLASVVRTFIFKQQGGQPIIRLDSYHLILSVLAQFYSAEWIYGAGRRYGYGSDMQREADGAVATPGKQMELDCAAMGPFRARRYFPNFAAGLEFVLELEQPVLAQVASAGSPTYSLSNAKMLVELVTGTAFLDEAVLSGMSAGIPLQIPVDSYRYVPQAVLANETVTQKNFSVQQDQVVTYFNRFILQSSLSTQTIDAFELNVNPGIVSQQLQLGGQLIPPQPLGFTNGAAEAIAEIHNAMFRHESPVSALMDGDAFSSNPPVGAVPSQTSRMMTAIAIGSARDAHVNAGLDLNTPPGQSTLRLNLAAPLSSVLQIIQVVNFVLHIRILPNQIESVG